MKIPTTMRHAWKCTGHAPGLCIEDYEIWECSRCGCTSTGFGSPTQRGKDNDYPPCVSRAWMKRYREAAYRRGDESDAVREARIDAMARKAIEAGKRGAR